MTDSMDLVSRRRLLQVGATGTAISIAGCGALDSADDSAGDSDANGGDGSENGTTGDLGTYTLQVAPDEEDFAEIEAEFQELQQEQMTGEIDEEEFEERQAELQDEVSELINEVISGIEEDVADTDDISILDTYAEGGVLLAEGTPAELLGLLDRQDVEALYEEAHFEDAQEPAEPQP